MLVFGVMFIHYSEHALLWYANICRVSLGVYLLLVLFTIKYAHEGIHANVYGSISKMLAQERRCCPDSNFARVVMLLMIVYCGFCTFGALINSPSVLPWLCIVIIISVLCVGLFIVYWCQTSSGKGYISGEDETMRKMQQERTSAIIHKLGVALL